MIYLDSASTHPLDKVAKASIIASLENFGNPSSLHSLGIKARAAIEEARYTLANCFESKPEQIIFTSSATESNNFVLWNAFHHLGVKQIITTAIEHASLLNPISYYETSHRLKVSIIPTDMYGNIALEDLLSKDLEEKSILCISHVNSEIGSVADIEAIGRICKENGILFHLDATQSIGFQRISFDTLPIDFLTGSAHKFGGTKGCGLLFLKDKSKLRPLLKGGSQEKGYRAGTENVLSIVAAGKTLYKKNKRLLTQQTHLESLKAHFISRLKTEIPNTLFNGGSEGDASSPKILNVRFSSIVEPIFGSIQFQLSLKGIACSQGSACQSQGSAPSSVLKAILNKKALSEPSIRFSLYEGNQIEDIDKTIQALKEIFQDLNSNSFGKSCI